MSDTPTNAEPTGGTETETDRDRLDTDKMQWVSAIVVLAGLGLVAYPFMFEATETAVWNGTLVGTAIFLLAGYNFYRLTRDRLASATLASLAALSASGRLFPPR